MQEKICNFVPQELIKEVVDREYLRIKNKILKLVPGAEVEHVGSSAVAGMLTNKDLDITVRVKGGDFLTAIKKFKKIFNPVHEKVWIANDTEGMAIFKEKTIPPDLESIDIVLVVKKSRFDEYHVFREILEKDECVRQDYNLLKKEHQGKAYRNYRKEKSEFWGDHG